MQETDFATSCTFWFGMNTIAPVLTTVDSSFLIQADAAVFVLNYYCQGC